MYIVRLAVAAVLAALTTVLLLTFMQLLIKQDELTIESNQSRKIADIQMGRTDIDVNVAARKPEKPAEPVAEPPPLTTAQPLADHQVATQVVSITPSLKADLSFSGARLSASDGEYLPIVKVPPEYPRRALQRNIEGQCTVEFTVTKTGSVRDPKIVQCDTLFEQASMQAVLKFKYKPRIENGEPVEVPGVRNMFTYKLSN